MILGCAIKSGVIGSGGRGGFAGHTHKPGQGNRIVAYCERNQVTLASNRDSCGANTFTTADCRVLLERDVEAAFVTTPDFLNEGLAIAALHAGKAVSLPTIATKVSFERNFARLSRGKRSHGKCSHLLTALHLPRL